MSGSRKFTKTQGDVRRSAGVFEASADASERNERKTSLTDALTSAGRRIAFEGEAACTRHPGTIVSSGPRANQRFETTRFPAPLVREGHFHLHAPSRVSHP
jgi:hypothetical protein